MLAELRLVIAPKQARLTFSKGEAVVENEVWTFDGKVSRTEAAELVEVAFHDLFDLLQHAVHGD
jgi:hypothetical protein